MTCIDIQFELATYVEGSARPAEVEAHLASCPLCRVAADEYSEIVADLRTSARPTLGFAADRSVRMALAREIRVGPLRRRFLDSDAAEWTQMRLMPLAVGTLASIVIGLGVVAFLLSDMNRPVSSTADMASTYGDTRFMLASNAGSGRSGASDRIFPAEYARNRLAFSGESPSLNPQGSLVALTGSMRPTRNASDGVVVIAEVFSDGLAQIQEVVTPVNDSKAIADLQRALDADLGDAPFVPASLDQRSDSVRVVLRFQRVDVDTRPVRRQRRH